MDIDLQDPPELIPAFLDRWREGYDVVNGMRKSRDIEGAPKRVTAHWFYRLFNLVSPVHIPENVGDFRLLDRKVVEELKKLRERNRFMKGLMSWPGFRVTCVEFDRPIRAAGESKWSFWKLWNLALDGIFSFSTLPLRLWMYVGAIIAALSLLYGVFIITYVLFYGRDVPGYASLIVTITFLGGIQLVSLGLIGEYLGRVIEEVKQRPIYIIDRIETSKDASKKDK